MVLIISSIILKMYQLACEQQNLILDLLYGKNIWLLCLNLRNRGRDVPIWVFGIIACFFLFIIIIFRAVYLCIKELIFLLQIYKRNIIYILDIFKIIFTNLKFIKSCLYLYIHTKLIQIFVAPFYPIVQYFEYALH
jgi:hypothetical protein